MRKETLLKTEKKIDWYWCENYTLPSLPMSQGLLIKHLIEHYKIPFKKVGYYMDIVGIKTKRQTMLWKDNGIGARFLGMITDDEVELPESKLEKNDDVFKSMKELSAEIKKRDYNNILGLSAEITEEDYMYFLEVLPPLRWDKRGFILSEALTDGLYYLFSKSDGKYFCKVVQLEDEELIVLEESR